MSLSLNNIVPVTLEVSATPAAARDFGKGIVITAASAVPGAGRVQTFTGAAAVAVAFPSDTPVQNFANTYFDSTYRSPPKYLKVGVFASGDATMTAALAACWNADPTFYGVACAPGTSDANQKLAGAWCASNGCRFFCCDQNSDCFTPAGTPTNLLWYFGKSQAVGRAMTLCSYALDDLHATGHAAMMALFMSVDYTQPNSIRTGMFKALGGIGATTFTQSQAEQICGAFDGTASPLAWNGNIYTTFGTTNMLARGQAADGRFEDEGIALDWLQSNLQIGVFNVMQQVPGKIPATDAGTELLIQGMIPTLNLARSNGLCAPGIWGFQGVGAVNTGDFLPAGYYVYGAPVSSQSVADRAARKAPPITIIMVGAGALQYCAPTVIFQR
jgi:hypothetical protein